MIIKQKRLRELIYEELSKADVIYEELSKADVKKIVADEVEKQLSSRKVRKILEDELVIALGKSKSKDEIADIAKKVLKRLYKDMAVQHPYMIDRIKV
jgi:Fe-S cluster assembly scaffold protein SufB